MRVLNFCPGFNMLQYQKMFLYNCVARTLKKLHTSKGEYYINMIFYNYVSFQIGTSLTGKNLLPKEQILSFKSSS